MLDTALADTLRCEFVVQGGVLGIAAPQPFDVLRPEYRRLWDSMVVTRQAAVNAIAARLYTHRDRYKRAEKLTGVPWFVIAAWHEREASGDFTKQLAQGDRLDRVSHNVPAGRGPFATWEEGCYDALVTLKHLDRVTDWHDPARICYETERYNGFGYRNYHPDVLSPYLWSFTTFYTRGKYVSDGHFDHNAQDAQCGAIAVIKRLMQLEQAEQPPAAPQVPHQVPPQAPTPSPTAQTGGIGALLAGIAQWLGAHWTVVVGLIVLAVVAAVVINHLTKPKP
jgi:lysozyme family protein